MYALILSHPFFQSSSQEFFVKETEPNQVIKAPNAFRLDPLRRTGRRSAEFMQSAVEGSSRRLSGQFGFNPVSLKMSRVFQLVGAGTTGNESLKQMKNAFGRDCNRKPHLKRLSSGLARFTSERKFQTETSKRIFIEFSQFSWRDRDIFYTKIMGF